MNRPSRLRARPVSRDEANAYIVANHSHHGPVRTRILCVGAELAGDLVGVAVVERPVARLLCDGVTAEVSRLCTNGTRNAASFLLGRSWRALKALGYARVVSYLRADELGTSYRAAGWWRVATVRAERWQRRAVNGRGTPFLPGFYVDATEVVERVRWEKANL